MKKKIISFQGLVDGKYSLAERLSVLQFILRNGIDDGLLDIMRHNHHFGRYEKGIFEFDYDFLTDIELAFYRLLVPTLPVQLKWRVKNNISLSSRRRIECYETIAISHKDSYDKYDFYLYRAISNLQNYTDYLLKKEKLPTLSYDCKTPYIDNYKVGFGFDKSNFFIWFNYSDEKQRRSFPTYVIEQIPGEDLSLFVNRAHLEIRSLLISVSWR